MNALYVVPAVLLIAAASINPAQADEIERNASFLPIPAPSVVQPVASDEVKPVYGIIGRSGCGSLAS